MRPRKPTEVKVLKILLQLIWLFVDRRHDLSPSCSRVLQTILFVGINIFLDGFVPTENLRFRETSLVFKVSETATEEEIKRLCCYDYPKMSKQLGMPMNNFTFIFVFSQFHLEA